MKTVNVTTEDGFSGTLQLDIGSIKSKVKGYKNSTHTVAETREYPNLSSPDTSLVPKSITVNGKQYNLADIHAVFNGEMYQDKVGALLSRDYKGIDEVNINQKKAIINIYGENGFAGYKESISPITASGGSLGGGSECLAVENNLEQPFNLVRRLTPLECERLMVRLMLRVKIIIVLMNFNTYLYLLYYILIFLNK